MSEIGNVFPAITGSTRQQSSEGAGADSPIVQAIPEPPVLAGPRLAPKRPWYFSTTVIALAYFIFSPVGSLLILTDRRRSKKAKIRAVAVLLFSLTLLTYRLFFMPPVQF